jgi:glycerol-3-phosphate dehydrogenase
VQFMLDEGEKLLPGFRQARALRVWAGVRPLYQPEQLGEVKETRDVSRTYTLIDHPARDGVENFLTITGGKFTTYRAMAEVTMDSVCRQLGGQRPCTTATSPLPDSEDGRYYWLGSRLAQREEGLHQDQSVCECELITRRRLEDSFLQRGSNNLDDMRRQLRLGMGPCQGGFCIYRAAGILHEAKVHNAAVADTALCNFLEERWKGVSPLLWGDQLRQAQLDDWIFQGLLDVEHLPRADPGSAT